MDVSQLFQESDSTLQKMLNNYSSCQSAPMFYDDDSVAEQAESAVPAKSSRRSKRLSKKGNQQSNMFMKLRAAPS